MRTWAKPLTSFTKHHMILPQEHSCCDFFSIEVDASKAKQQSLGLRRQAHTQAYMYTSASGYPPITALPFLCRWRWVAGAKSSQNGSTRAMVRYPGRWIDKQDASYTM